MKPAAARKDGGADAARACIGIRTHRFGDAEQALYRELCAFFRPEDVYIVVDETSSPLPVPAGYRKVSFDKAALADAGLYAGHERTGWLCGDYFYYFLRRQVAASHYWLIEPDVRFTYADVGDFFRLYSDAREDFIAPAFGPRGARWPWHRHAESLAANVYGCAFPLTRLTAAAIDRLFMERKKLSQPADPRLYPNDESFVATTLVRLGMPCADMARYAPDAFSHFSVSQPYPWGEVAATFPRDKVVHPAVDGDAFWAQFERKLDHQLGAAGLRRLLSSAAAGGSAAHVARLRAEVLAGVGRWLDRAGLPSGGQPARLSADKAAAPEARGKVRRYPVTGSAKGNFSITAPSDFTLGDGVAIAPRQVDLGKFAPYCFDWAADAFLLVNTPQSAREEPFFYQAQFRGAKSALVVDRKVMRRICAVPDGPAAAAPVLVFSTGRCGSTLFSKLSGCAGLVDFSEPDVLTNINSHRKDPRVADVLKCGVAALATYAGVPEARLSIKLRSGSCVAVDHFLANFPASRYVFLRRNLRDWSASFIAKFNWKNEQLLGTLVAGARAMDRLAGAGVDYSLLQYEDFSRSPESVYRILAGTAEMSAETRDYLARVAAKDAQVGSGIGDRQASRAETDARVQSFLDYWQAHAPADVRSHYYLAAEDVRA